MTTFNEWRERAEKAEKVAAEETLKGASAEAQLAEIRAKTQAAIQETRDIAEKHFRDAEARVEAAETALRMTEKSAAVYAFDAQSYGHERDKFWQEVFLAVLRHPTTPQNIGYATSLANEAVMARAALQSGENGMSLHAAKAVKPPGGKKHQEKSKA